MSYFLNKFASQKLFREKQWEIIIILLSLAAIYLKENFTLIHEIWLLLINYSFLWFYDLLFLKHQKIDNRSWDTYVFSHIETRFCTISE